VGVARKRLVDRCAVAASFEPMTAADTDRRVAPRTLPGATVLQIVRSLADDEPARATVDVALALLRSGARAIVAGADGPLVSELQGIGGEWIRLAGATHNPLSARRNVRTLEEFVATERVDIVHARGVAATLSGAAVSTTTGTWLVSSYGGPAGAHRWYERGYGRALAGSARVIAHSAYVANDLMARHKVDPERVTVIPRRIDTQVFDPAQINPARVATVRRAWKMGRGARVFLVPGRLDPRKGQLTVVDAARMLVTGGLKDVVFVFAGDDRPDAEYAQMITSHAAAQGIGTMIRRVGTCRDMPAAYAASDIVIIPAIEAPTFGRAAAEAFAMGRPVVASAVGALPEIVRAPPAVPERERIGWLCAPGDPIDLARAIADAVETDTATRRAIAAAAYRFARDTFSPAHIAARTLAVYAALLRSNV
jgi:glycosyltransferase involved in cell wall biosynthesis